MTNRSQLSWALVALAALLFLFSLARWVMQDPPQTTGATALDAAELDALRPYLGPARQLPPWLDEAADQGRTASGTRGGSDPWQDPPPPPVLAASELDQAWSVTAILLRPGYRVAVLNDRPVRPGDVLPGGVRVAAIEADRVVLQSRNGARQTVWLNERGENG